MAESYNLPVVPMRNSVLFPGVGLPINAGRPGTLRAIEAAVNSSDKRVFAVGDVRSGSMKRVAAAVGEGSAAVQLVHKVLAE